MTLFLAIFLTTLLVLWTLFWLMVGRDELKRALHLLRTPALNRPIREDIVGGHSPDASRDMPGDHVLGLVVSILFIVAAAWAAFRVWSIYSAGIA